MSRVVVAAVLVVLLAAQGCVTRPSTPLTVPRQGQLDEAMLRDSRDCEAAAERVSGYSNQGVVTYWIRAVAGTTIVAVAVAATIVTFVLAIARGGQLHRETSTGAQGPPRDPFGGLQTWIGSEPELGDYLAKYQDCMKARGYEVSQSEP